MKITARDKRLYDLAVRVAISSECEDKHGAVLARGGTVRRLAPNSNAGGRGLAVTQHAEQRVVNLYLKAWGPGDEGWLAGLTVYSARYHHFPISKPCETCQEAMRRVGIQRVIYHDGWKLQELTT